jgi:hypothetical protein
VLVWALVVGILVDVCLAVVEASNRVGLSSATKSAWWVEVERGRKVVGYRMHVST